MDKRQSLLILIADQKACEYGWVLHLAINHKGQILPFRMRDQALVCTTNVGAWLGGQTLDENTANPDEDAEYYRRENVSGWDCT